MATATLKLLLTGEDRSASKSVKGLGDQAGKTQGKLHGLRSSAGKALAGGLLAGGAIEAGKALLDMAKGAAEDETAHRRLAKQMRNSAGATKAQIDQTENWITKQGQVLGVTDDELRPALGRLVAVTHNVGKAQKLTSLAMDVSAGTGKSLKTVTEALAKAQAGNVGGLSRLGVATKDASGKTLSLDKITKNLATTYKGQASAAANTTEGKFRRLHVQLSEAGETIGYKLIPVALKLANFFINKVIPAATKFAGAMQKHKPLMIAVAGAVGLLLGGPLFGLAAMFIVLWTRSEKFRTVATKAFKGIVTIFLGLVGALLNGAAKAFGWVPGLGPKLKHAADKFNHFRDNVNRALAGIHDQTTTIEAHTRNALSQIAGVKRALASIPKKVRTDYYVNQVNAINKKASGQLMPGHALGTAYWSGGMTGINERGQEAIYLPGGSRIVPASRASQGGGSGGGSTTVNVTINGALDPVAVGKQVQQVLLKLKRTNGGASLGLA